MTTAALAGAGSMSLGALTGFTELYVAQDTNKLYAFVLTSGQLDMIIFDLVTETQISITTILAANAGFDGAAYSPT